MYRQIAGTDERVRVTPGVRDRRVRATKVRLYPHKIVIIIFFPIKHMFYVHKTNVSGICFSNASKTYVFIDGFLIIHEYALFSKSFMS